MSTNRFLTLLLVMALMVVIALTARQSIAKDAAVSDVDSATRSYMGWAEAVEAQSAKSASIPVAGSSFVIDSATQSYVAWAKAVECGANLAYDHTIDSATRSYVGWAKSMQCGNAP
jgi:predicted lipid-binding transport protein (Tim44 family)